MKWMLRSDIPPIVVRQSEQDEVHMDIRYEFIFSDEVHTEIRYTPQQLSDEVNNWVNLSDEVHMDIRYEFLFLDEVNNWDQIYPPYLSDEVNKMIVHTDISRYVVHILYPDEKMNLTLTYLAEYCPKTKAVSKSDCYQWTTVSCVDLSCQMNSAHGHFRYTISLLMYDNMGACHCFLQEDVIFFYKLTAMLGDITAQTLQQKFDKW